MFLRTVKARGGKGSQIEYVRLVENNRQNGKVKQRLVASLGRKDMLESVLDDLIRLLRGQPDADDLSLKTDRVSAVQALDWGPFLVVRTLWRELGLEEILDRWDKPRRRNGGRLADRALALVANRLEMPGSEHGLARWLETSYACDRHGQRWQPEWRDDETRLASRSPRVRVDFGQLQRWYRTLDQLLAVKSAVERDLFLRLRDLFALKVDLVLYDLTSTYFEGQGPAGLALHGHSRDDKPRNRQVLVGMVMVDGWPIAHHVFAGNRRDLTTVPEVLQDLEQRFGLRRVVFVGDRGMVSKDILELLRKHRHGYIVGRNRRRSAEVFGYIERATGPWQRCPVGITANEKSKPPVTEVQEVAGELPGQRIFVVHSEERQVYERAEREKSMARVRKKLQALQQRVAAGKLKKAEKIGAAAGRIMSQNHGHRYYDWAYEDGRFRFFEHPVNFTREQAYEGKYVIQTEEPGLSPVQAVQLYKQLSEVERTFRNLKDVIQMRPVYHQTKDRTQAHIFVAVLAFLLQRAIEKKLKAAGLDLSASEALSALKTVRVVDIDLGDGKNKRCVTSGSQRAARILSVLGIKDRQVPNPPEQPKHQV